MTTQPRASRPAPDWPKRLLAHYQSESRDLPWRRTRDPYAIYVSEIMLQQTQVQTVIPYYNRFLERFPDLESLAAADPDEVHKLWEGLGYYSRARQMQESARQMVAQHGARVPSDPALLRALPGVGAYTAGAIGSIAFGRPVPAVDGNVVRVIARLYGWPLTQGSVADRDRVAALIEPLIPGDAPGDFNQALMEFGATVCTPAAPRCPACPLNSDCTAFHEGRVPELPLKPKKKTVASEDFTVVVVKTKSLFRVMRREQGLLSGLYQFDLLPGRLEKDAILAWLASDLAVHDSASSDIRVLPDRTHRFTHRLWRMSGFAVTLGRQPQEIGSPGDHPESPILWVTPDELTRLPFPTALAAYRDDALRVPDDLSRTNESTSSSGRRK